MRKKKGFTLVELLAVIVILAIILVIGVPKIVKTIDEARNGAIVSSAKLIAAGAEREYVSRKTLGDTSFEGLDKIPCEDVVEMNKEDYGKCTVSFEDDGTAVVSLHGQGKFRGKYVCGATRELAVVTTQVCIPVKLNVMLNGGEDNFDYEEVYESNSLVPLVEPTKEDSIFDGWRVTLGSDSGAKVEGNILTMGTEETTVEALWTDKVPLIVELGEGGEANATYEAKYKPGEKVILANPTREGYKFIIWSVSGEGASIDGNELTMGTGTTTVTAVWKKYISLTVNVGENAEANATYEEKYLEGAQVTLTNPTRSGYVFKGWDVSGTGASINNENVLTIGTDATTVTAKWNELIELTVNLNEGSASANPSGKYETGSKVTLTVPTRSGYKFVEWTISGTGSSLNGNVVTIGTSATTVSAEWIKLVTVTVNTEAGVTVSAVNGNLKYEKVANSSGVAVFENFEVGTWNFTLIDRTFTTDPVVENITANKELTLSFPEDPAYSQSIVLSGSSGTWTVPDAIKNKRKQKIKVVVIGTGATGGNGSAGSTGSKAVYGSGGAGGAGGKGGAAGAGGKIYTQEISSLGIDSFTYGQSGVNTYFTGGDYNINSSSGSSLSSGYTGELGSIQGTVYAKPGIAGQKGAAGGKGGWYPSPISSGGSATNAVAGSNVTYNGTTYKGGSGASRKTYVIRSESNDGYVGGGGGGGAAVGSNGSAGSNSNWSSGTPGGAGGAGAAGAAATAICGSGGNGGHGGGGGGGGGTFINYNWLYTAEIDAANSGGSGGAGGAGGAGSAGAAGCVIIYY